MKFKPSCRALLAVWVAGAGFTATDGSGARAAEVADLAAAEAAAKRMLPDSDGRDQVARACTKCHDLGGLDAYKGYWNRMQWQEMVESMVKNGAELTATEQQIVTEYLTRHFGPGTRQ